MWKQSHGKKGQPKFKRIQKHGFFKFPGSLWQVSLIYFNKSWHPSASGQGPQSTGKLQGAEQFESQRQPPTVYVKEQQGVREEEEEGKQGEEVTRKLGRQEKRKSVQTKDNETGLSERTKNTELSRLTKDTVTLLYSIIGTKYMTIDQVAK